MPRLFLFFLALAAASPVLAQPLGPRLGADISRAERDYFGLFPGVGDAFASARVVNRQDRVDVVVTRTGAPDTTLSMDFPAATALQQFTETFEQAATPFENPHWQRAVGPADVRRLDATARVPHVDPGAALRVVVGTQRLEGVVLVATDTLLLLHPATPYRWDAPAVARLRPADIARVEFTAQGIERFQRVVRFAGAGLAGLLATATDVFLLDGGARALPTLATAASLGYAAASVVAPAAPDAGAYAARLPALRDRAAFRVRVPLDFRPVDTPPSALARGTTGRSAPQRLLARWRRDYGWVNVALLGAASGTLQPAGSYAEYRNVPTPNTQTVPTLFGTVEPEWGVDVALRPVPFLRVGGTWTSARTQTPPLEGEEVATYEPPSLRGYAEAVLPSPRVRGLGLDLAVGAGLETAATRVQGDLYGGDPPYRFDVASSARVRFVQGSLDLVLPQRSSVFVRLTSREVPAVDIAGAEVRSTRFPDIVVYRVEPHTVTFGRYREWTWGTRVRF